MLLTSVPSPERRNNGFLIALHGLPRAGKDIIANRLMEYGYTRAAFATALYREVSATFGVTPEQLASHEWKTQPQLALLGRNSQCAKYRAVLQNRGVNMYEPQTSRFHLQLWGTEYRRVLFDRAYWTNEIDFTLSHVRGPIVITDLRFRDEHDYLSRFAWRTNRQFRVLEILRESVAGSSHVSDMHLGDAFIDLAVHNVEGDPSIAVNTVLHYLGITQERDHDDFDAAPSEHSPGA